MGDIFSKREIVKFENVVLNHDRLPKFAKTYIGFLNKVLNIPKHVEITCVFLVSIINIYSIKRQKRK